MALAVVLILLVVGTVAFHLLNPWWFTPIASNWQTVDDTVQLTFVVTGIAFVVVNLFLAYSVIRYRHRHGTRAQYEPENKKLEWWLTIGTSVGIVAMLAPGLNVWADFVTVPDDAATVEVLGQQWTWSYRFPGQDGQLGTTDARDVTVDNPFGMNPDDPKGQDDVLISSPELHLPVNKPVQLRLRSNDVLHQFAVPQFRVKMDVVPGMVTHFWLTPTRTGPFDALCEQLCGTAHFVMRGRVFVDEAADFETWLAGHPTYAQVRARAAADPVAGQATYTVCSTCHGAKAEGNVALNAPKLSGQDAWYLERQLRAFRHGLRGASDKDIYAKQMVPFAAMLPDDATIRNVAAHIASLPEVRPAVTVSGDPERGRVLYRTCAGCHGADGQGVWSTNAPRLAGMNDWYLERQLQHFRQRIRGGHRQDFNGAQMAVMADVLQGDQAIRDLVVYVQGL